MKIIDQVYWKHAQFLNKCWQIEVNVKKLKLLIKHSLIMKFKIMRIPINRVFISRLKEQKIISASTEKEM